MLSVCKIVNEPVQQRASGAHLGKGEDKLVMRYRIKGLFDIKKDGRNLVTAGKSEMPVIGD